MLKEAGQENLSIELFAPDDTAGLPEYVTAFAEQAKEAGIKITATVLDGGTYWGAEYTKRVFATSYWSTRPYLNQVAAGALPTAHLSRNPLAASRFDFEELYNEAIAEVDHEKRYAIIRQMQQEEYEEGGNIIAYFQNLIDGHASYVKGAVASPEPVQLRPLRSWLQEHLAGFRFGSGCCARHDRHPGTNPWEFSNSLFVECSCWASPPSGRVAGGALASPMCWATRSSGCSAAARCPNRG